MLHIEEMKRFQEATEVRISNEYDIYIANQCLTLLCPTNGICFVTEIREQTWSEPMVWHKAQE